MKRTMMHGKIHRATVTDGNVDYVGSITLDADLIDAAGILEFEKVHVVDVDNGARLETYVLKGERGSGDVILNGAAARLINKGDKVIVIAYGEMEDVEARSLKPRIVLVDDSNRQVPVATGGGPDFTFAPTHARVRDPHPQGPSRGKGSHLPVSAM